MPMCMDTCSGIKPLSPRQVVILRRIAEGRENKQIAYDMGITENTVKTHVKEIFYRLEAKDRAHAVALAIRRGLV